MRFLKIKNIYLNIDHITEIHPEIEEHLVTGRYVLYIHYAKDNYVRYRFDNNEEMQEVLNQLKELR